MKNIITKTGLELLSKRLDEKMDLLKKIREEKAHAYTASGDGWHDNPGWIQIGQQEDFLVSEIIALQNRVASAVLVKTPSEIINKVQIGCKVEFSLKNIKTGSTSTQNIILVGNGESDFKSGRISYDSPIGNALVNMKIDEEKVLELPTGSINIKIIEINYEN